MRSATLYRYHLPLEAGVILRHQRLKARSGLLLHLQQGERQGWGEIAPLPGFSRETLSEAEAETRRWLQQWQADGSALESPLPSVAFGCSCAEAELMQRLPLSAEYRTVPLCSGDPDELFERLQALPGDKIAKMKVGWYEAVRDGMIASLLLEALPDLTLRLDANRGWSRAKAEGFARYLAPALRPRIAFLEEPCHTREESLAFARETGIAIAWDESVREEGFQIQAEPGVAAVIIKPTLMGSIERCRTWIAQAQAVGLQAVISSSIESSLGLTQLARLAGWLTPETLPGLDTLALMQAQLLRPWPGSPLPLLSLESLERVWPE